MRIQWSGVNGSRTIVETEAGPHAFDAGPRICRLLPVALNTRAGVSKQLVVRLLWIIEILLPLYPPCSC